MPRKCDHLTVTRGYLDNEPIWTCVHCADQFVPVVEMERLETETNGALDMACAMFSNILVDVCRRLGQPEPAFTEDSDVEHEHQWKDGECSGCGASQFLGG